MKMQENLNIDFQTGFGFELNGYDDTIIRMDDDAGREGPWRRNFIYIVLYETQTWINKECCQSSQCHDHYHN